MVGDSRVGTVRVVRSIATLARGAIGSRLSRDRFLLLLFLAAAQRKVKKRWADIMNNNVPTLFNKQKHAWPYTHIKR
jgi:hypothetical protein